MNPDTGAMYASVDEAVSAGENPDDIVTMTGRREQINKIITDLHAVDRTKAEKRRQVEKKRRVVTQASRKKNRRKK